MQTMSATNSARPAPLKAAPANRQSGFTLIELSVALVIIGLIIGAITIGRDVQRNAVYQRIASDYVQGWAIAYDRFYDGTGRPPGDSATAPTGIVSGVAGTPLCGVNLLNAMQAAGVDLPSGRAEGAADRYAYLDSNGNPQELRICFSNVVWSEPDATSGTYVTRYRNVMTLNGMTPALASLLDNAFDSMADAAFGRFRVQSQANITTSNHAGGAWSKDDRWAYGSSAVPAAPQDESQVGVVDAYLKMSR